MTKSERGMIKGYSFPKGFIIIDNKEYMFMASSVKGRIENRMQVDVVIENDMVVKVFGQDVEESINEPLEKINKSKGLAKSPINVEVHETMSKRKRKKNIS